MKIKWITSIFLIFLFSTTHSKTYYISNSGNNLNNGLAENTTWKTLAHAVLSVKSGDSILLKKGDVFREKADFKAAKIINLYIGSYGTSDAKPVILGSEVVTGWTLWKDNIYTANSNLDIQYLYVNNNLMTIARFPNKGWLKISSSTLVNGKTTIAANGLNKGDAAGYWTGAKMRWRRWSWWFETHTITNSDASGKINIAASTAGDNVTGWGFYLDNKLSELDTINEWYRDKTANKLYLYIPSGTNINDLLVEGSIRDAGLVVDSSVVDGICFRQQTMKGLSIAGQSIVRNCRFEWIGSDGGGAALESSWSIVNAHIHHNYFINNLNNTIQWNENPANGGSSKIEYNTFLNCGIVPAYGGAGSWHASGIVVQNATNLRIRYNKFDKVGYCAVIMGREKNFVENNVIKNAMYTLNDGGAVYTNCHRTTIKGNIILNTKGDLESSGPWSNLGHGIWPEFLSEFRESVIEDNTVAGSGGFGLFLPNNFACSVKNNTFYNNKRSQLDLSGDAAKGPQGHIIENNILFGASASQSALTFKKGVDYGTVQNNYIGNPYTYNEINNAYFTEQWNYMYPWVKTTNNTDSIKIPAFRTWNLGSEMIADSPFNTVSPQWTADAKSTPVVISSASDQPLLNDKCMKISFNAGKIICNYQSPLNMTTGQFYELKFDYIFQNLDVSTSNPQSSFLLVSITDSVTRASIGNFFIPASKNRRKAWFVFYSPVAGENIRLQISHSSGISNTIWIDNMSMKTAEGQKRNPLNESKLLYNDTTFARKIAVGSGKWHSLDGKPVSDSILLNPFTSIILIRNEVDSIGGEPPFIIPVSKEMITASDLLMVYPNPVHSNVTLENLSESGEIMIINTSGQILFMQKYYSDKIILNVESLSNGLYYIIVSPDKGTRKTSKFLKM